MNTFRFFVLLGLSSPLVLCADLYVRGGLFYEDAGDVSFRDAASASAAWDAGVGFSAALGYQIAFFRLEGELTYFDTTLDRQNAEAVDLDADLERLSAFANAYVEMPGLPLVSPYLGLGLGVTRLDVETSGALLDSGGTPQLDLRSSADEMQFAVQAMAGVRVSLLETVSAYGAIRYVLTDDLSFDDETNTVSFSADGGELAFELGVAVGF